MGGAGWAEWGGAGMRLRTHLVAEDHRARLCEVEPQPLDAFQLVVAQAASLERVRRLRLDQLDGRRYSLPPVRQLCLE